MLQFRSRHAAHGARAGRLHPSTASRIAGASSLETVPTTRRSRRPRPNGHVLRTPRLRGPKDLPLTANLYYYDFENIAARGGSTRSMPLGRANSSRIVALQAGSESAPSGDFSERSTRRSSVCKLASIRCTQRSPNRFVRLDSAGRPIRSRCRRALRAALNSAPVRVGESVQLQHAVLLAEPVGSRAVFADRHGRRRPTSTTAAGPARTPTRM